MAYDPTPTATLPSWASDGTTITVPLASLPGLEAVDADETTGDLRAIAYAFLETLFAAQEAAAAADRSTAMRITRATREQPTGVVRSYTFTFTLGQIAVAIADE